MVERRWDLKEGNEMRRIKMMRKGLRMALGKVKRRKLCYLSLVRLVVLFFFFNCYFLFCDLNV